MPQEARKKEKKNAILVVELITWVPGSFEVLSKRVLKAI